MCEVFPPMLVVHSGQTPLLQLAGSGSSGAWTGTQRGYTYAFSQYSPVIVLDGRKRSGPTTRK